MSLIAQMGSLLLRSTPPPPSYDTDAQELFAAFTGTPSNKLKTAINNYILKLKYPARWDPVLGAIWSGTTYFACPQGVDTNEHDRLLIWNNPDESVYKLPPVSGRTQTTSSALGLVAGSSPAATCFSMPNTGYAGSFTRDNNAVSMYVTSDVVVSSAAPWFDAGAYCNLYSDVAPGRNARGRPILTVDVYTPSGQPATKAGDELSVSRTGTPAFAVENGVAGPVNTFGPPSVTPTKIYILSSSSTAGTAGRSVGRIYVGRGITAAENAMLRQIHNEYLAELAS